MLKVLRRLFKRSTLIGLDEHANLHEVSWESLQQIEPLQLRTYIGIVPYPWSCVSRGNGHHDVIDAHGHRFAHIYCWSSIEHEELAAILRESTADESCLLQN